MKRTRTFTSFFLPEQALLVMIALLNFAPTCFAQQPSPTPAPSPAPSPSPAEIQAEVLETLKQLRQQVAELQQRTKELEARPRTLAPPMRRLWLNPLKLRRL
jgi:hypothetical protein